VTSVKKDPKDTQLKKVKIAMKFWCQIGVKITHAKISLALNFSDG
jgi:hypothetical protein